ncbi:hypothetical protein BKE38_06035 [Pseudoroseomonas deserti]|uniref:Uncharacterized protein n=1 Tax=Teichococcus deserti TaxID=1817963 RepID=A0A1V2H7T8_9PROT|nr:hypothetical protein [Pseudoroseomonas deserti]ONG56371.1 hypothetical protein BKE38_06035 [Pseudoroseomonas deserti]
MKRPGLSRNALKSLDVDQSAAGAPPDRRAKDIAELITVDEEAMRTIAKVFAGTSLPKDPRKVRSLLKLRGEVNEAWSQARNAFVQIGRALNDLDSELTRDERDRLRLGFQQLFPFSETVASQFRQIALAVDEGRLPLEVLPGSYGTAYQLALLKPAELEEAQLRGLLRADVTRNAVIQFRREVLAVARHRPAGLDRNRLLAELRRIEADRRRLVEQLARLRVRRRQISAILSGEEG